MFDSEDLQAMAAEDGLVDFSIEDDPVSLDDVVVAYQASRANPYLG